jgi:hypothetical protein
MSNSQQSNGRYSRSLELDDEKAGGVADRCSKCGQAVPVGAHAMENLIRLRRENFDKENPNEHIRS